MLFFKKMWLGGGNVHHHWRNAKHVIGKAWHEGGKFLGQIDQVANMGTRFFGAVAPLLGENTLRGGVRAIDQYSSLRNQVQSFDRGAKDTLGRLRAAAPELGL